MVCQELRSAHMKKGGRDPAFVDASSLGSAPAVTEDAASRQASNPRTGLHPSLLFRNQKFSSRKALVAPDRKLRPVKLNELEATCKSKWDGMSGAERASWERVYTGWSIDPQRSTSARSVVPRDCADPVVFSPWCGVGSVDKPIPVQAIADYISGTPPQTLTQLSRSDASLDEVHTATPRAFRPLRARHMINNMGCGGATP